MTFTLGLLGTLLLVATVQCTNNGTDVTNSLTQSPANQEPRFVEEPEEHYYVIKGRPVTMTCGAVYAVQLTFNCAGQWVRATHHVTSTNGSLLRASIDVTRQDIDTHDLERGLELESRDSLPISELSEREEDEEAREDFWCQCHAWPQLHTPQPALPPQSTASRRAYVHVAYLRKQFEREPMSVVAEVGSSVLLQCLPPAGLPQPQVFWLKNGQPIDISIHSNFIISSEANLIIKQLRLSDTANYTCGCHNIVARRLTEPASVTVYVPGVWSSWSPWSPCAAQCPSFQTRSRSCTHASVSDANIRCAGLSTHTSPCACFQADDVTRQSTVEVNTAAIYGAVSAAIGVFTLITVMVVCVTRFRRISGSLKLPLYKRQKGFSDQAPPDITQNLIDHVANDSSPAALYTPLVIHRDVISASPVCVSVASRLAPPTCHTPRHALHTPIIGHSPPPLSFSPPPHSDGQSEAGEYCNLMRSCSSDMLVTCSLTSSGQRLALDDLGASWTVPGVVTRDTDAYLSICDDTVDKPRLLEGRTLLAPVVTCGLTSRDCLSLPAVLTVEHCANIRHGHWTIEVWTTGDLHLDDNTPRDWTMVCTTDQTVIFDDVRACLQVDVTHCHVMTALTGYFAVVGRPSQVGTRPVKMLWLVVCATLPPSACQCSLRVYLVDCTLGAIRSVQRVEQGLSGVLLCQPRPFPVQYGAGDVTVTMSDLQSPWRCKLDTTSQEVPCEHVWSQAGDLHCSFILQSSSPVECHRQPLQCTVTVCQTNTQEVTDLLCDTVMDISSLSQLLDNSWLCYCGNQRHQVKHCLGGRCADTGDVCQHKFRLEDSVRERLCDLLDADCSRGNNWRMLSQRLGTDRFMTYLSSQESPTRCLLWLWEARHCGCNTALIDLANTLRVMGRVDVAAILDTSCHIT